MDVLTVAGMGRVLGQDQGKLLPLAIDYLFTSDADLASKGRQIDAALEVVIDRLCLSLAVAKPVGLVTWAEARCDAFGYSGVMELTSAAASAIAHQARSYNVDHGRLLASLELHKAEVERAIAPKRKTVSLDGPPISPEAVTALLAVLAEHDEGTCQHSRATGEWARRLAEGMGLSPERVEFVEQCSILHDIGKVETPSSILLNTGSLSDEEWSVMREHVAAGARILTSIPSLARCAPIVRAHHERFDGAGYPDGLAGEQIPLEARIVAVADAFHAMISDRPYRPAIPPRQALQILSEGRNAQWDGKVVDAMLGLFKQYRPQRSVADGTGSPS